MHLCKFEHGNYNWYIMYEFEILCIYVFANQDVQRVQASYPADIPWS